jgi:hypothetical protein
MSASPHFRGAAHGINYDLTDAGLGADIGPRHGPGLAGNLANVAYFGTSRGGGTVPDPIHAAEAEAEVIERYLGEIGERL